MEPVPHDPRPRLLRLLDAAGAVFPAGLVVFFALQARVLP
jgi:hypothetical protein